jgi:hypothetical protein
MFLNAGGDPDIMDCIGMTGREWIETYKYSDKFKLPAQKNMSPTPSEQRKHIIRTMLKRIRLMRDHIVLLGQLDALLSRPLMCLKDDEAAIVVQRWDIDRGMSSEIVHWNYECSACTSKSGDQYLCRTCAVVILCAPCVKKRTPSVIPFVKNQPVSDIL